MSFSEFEKRLAEEHRRRLRELEGIVGSSLSSAVSAKSILLEQQNLLTSQARQALLASIEGTAARSALAHRGLLESIHATQARAFRNIFDGVGNTARESIARTIANINASTAPVLGAAAANAIRGVATLAASTNILASMRAITASVPKSYLESTARAVAEASRIDLTRLGAINGSAALAALNYSGVSLGIAHVRALQASYAGQLAETIRQILSADLIDEDAAAPLQVLVAAKVNELEKGKISAEGLVTLLLTIVGVIISLMGYKVSVDSYKLSAEQAASSDKSDAVREHQLEMVNSLLEQAVREFQRLQPDRDDNTYYIVDREVTLRVKPNTKAAPIAVIFPNQKVRLEKNNHKWIYVEYFDYIEGVPKYGWAYKKYLKKLN
jgi:hypothetical protein